MSLITARNSVTNKINVINIDDDGKLKIDESGKLTDIELNTDTTNTRIADTNTKLDTVNSKLTGIDGLLTTIDSDTGDIRTLTGTSANSLTALETDLVDRRINLQYQRSLGKCFSIALVDSTQTTGNNFYLMTLFNPSGSGKTIYIYDLNFGANIDLLTSGSVLLQVLKLTSMPSNGSLRTPTNMHLDSTVTSSALILRDAITVSPGDVIYNSKQAFSSSSSDLEYIEIDLNLKDDMIEIPENRGIVLKVNRDAAQNMFCHCNIKYVEL